MHHPYSPEKWCRLTAVEVEVCPSRHIGGGQTISAEASSLADSTVHNTDVQFLCTRKCRI